MTRVAIIPARGGSKRLPRKNIRPFHGKPIIHYAIEAALQSKLFALVAVSTDDSEIAQVAIMGGAEVINRPAEFATDYATTAQVMKHALGMLMVSPEYACCIYPCTPFLRPADLHKGYDELVGKGAIYAFPVVAHHPPVQRMMRLSSDGLVEPVWPQFEMVRTQDLEPRYHDAGQWYWGTLNAWLNDERPIHGGERTIGIPTERLRAIDIDTYEDWLIAEAIYAKDARA